jgi:pseudouridine synthase
MSVMRLQRALARAGVTSRRKAEDLIRAGRVRIDGRVARIGESVDPDRQDVTVDGRGVRPAPLVWLALNKPIGYVVSRGDPEGRRTVYDLLPGIRGLTYVGRLDVMTSGLLLLTTDGEAAHRLMHPRFEIERTYWMRVHGADVDEIRRRLTTSIVIDDRPVRVERLRVRPAARARAGRAGATGGGARSVEVELTLKEGRHRIVRRVAEAHGLKIEWLHRVAYGPVRLGHLAEGKHRALTPREIGAIEAVVGRNRTAEGVVVNRGRTAERGKR